LVGTQFNNTVQNIEAISTNITPPTPLAVASATKNVSQEGLTEEDATKTVPSYFNFIMDSDLFMSLILMISRCPDCGAAVNIEH